MNVVDSSAWIEYFVDGPNARLFAGALADTGKLVVPTVCLVEVYRWVLSNHHRGAALNSLAAMRQGLIVDLDATLAVQAAELGLRHRLPLADSIVYATGRSRKATVWTQDADFEGLEGVEYFPRQ